MALCDPLLSSSASPCSQTARLSSSPARRHRLLFAGLGADRISGRRVLSLQRRRAERGDGRDADGSLQGNRQDAGRWQRRLRAPGCQAVPAAITAEQVKNAAGVLLGSRDSVIVIVGDYAKVKDQLAGFTNITFLDTQGNPTQKPK